MLTPKFIEKAIKLNFSSNIRQRGKGYFDADMVEDFYIDKDDEITATVFGSYDDLYEVEMDINKAGRINGYCDCLYEANCKHMVAVLYEIKEELEEKMTKVQVIPIGRKSNTILEGGNAGKYRKLPIIDNNLNDALSLYRNGSVQRLPWNVSYEGSFITKNEIELTTTVEYEYYHYKKQSIRIKYEEGDFWVKCLTCKSNTKKLCSHQSSLLHAAEPNLIKGFVDGSQDYEAMIEEGVKEIGVSIDAFDQYFQVKLIPQGFSIQSIKPNLVQPKWIKNTQELLEVNKEDQKRSIDKQTALLKEGRGEKYAFLWGTDEEYEKAVYVYFVKGFGYKTKEGIQNANRKMEEIPRGLPSPYQQLGQELFFLLKEENQFRSFELIQNFIKENIEDLNNIYQYVYAGMPLYRSPKNSDLHLIQFYPTPLDCRFKVYKKDGLIHIECLLTHKGKPFDLSKMVYKNQVFCTTREKAYLFSNYYVSDILEMFNGEHTIIVPFTNKREYSSLINRIKQNFEVEVEDTLIFKEEILSNPTYQILLREAGNFVLFEPRLNYGEYSFNAYDEGEYIMKRKTFRADETDRTFLADFLMNAHVDFKNNHVESGYTYLDIKSMINNYWFIHFNEACEAAGIELLGQKELTKFKYSKHRAQTFSHVKSGIDWFDVDMGVSFGDEKIKTADWIRALRNNESFVKLKDGTLGVLPEEWLKQAQQVLAIADVEKGNIKISKYRFNIIDDLFEEIDDKQIIKELKEKKERLANINVNKKYTLPKIVNAKLRTYQKHGYAWLKFLEESGLGGILADDMGLGKTLQVISLLADQIGQAPSLVIVPRSLLFNWGAELDKFCEKLKYIIHHGLGRSKKIEELVSHHIIITTYGTAAADIELLKEYKFNYIILDESQAIKNPNSKRYKAMRLLQSRNKIAMTGTPIENNTFDLYAQLSFTSPGLLGTKTSFKNNFAIPIDNHGDLEAAKLLRKLIHPFLLRRTKEQVAKDLPAKTESIIYCEMGNTQRKLYNNLKQKIKEDIEAEVEEKGVAKSKFKMLDGLLRLRQMCNSPLLLNASFSGANADSVKINILIQHLSEQLEKHNALIFSQFVSLLSILRKELDAKGIKYAYLDGSTTKRQKEVEKFMKNDEVKVFLISLKAGNTGLNLTKADYVYILDPWWNPAVEAQAIDRTHRIGQDKQIFAYKLICKDSIEEKILKLQEKKKNLAKDIIRTDENVLKSLNKGELMALFD